MLKRACLIAVAAGSPVAAQAPPGRTIQAVFDSAQAAFEKSDWKGAISGYREVLAHMKPGSRSAPAVHARLANALVHDSGSDTAMAEADAAIKGFAALGITKDGDLAAAYLLRADNQRAHIDNAAAITSYQAAIAAAQGADSRVIVYGAHIGLGFAAVTVNPDLAAAAFDAEINDAAYFATINKIEQSALFSYRALAELNRGNAKDAARLIEKALDQAGRTTTRVNLAQVGIRGNAALIYARLHRDDDVRQYLSYSGAGHLPSDEWQRGADTPLPVCDTDILPTDFAVVEFAIGSNGHTAGASALYASRPGVIGTAFAAKVRDWRWRPAAVAKLDPFWRASVRMELRCVKRPDPIQLVDSFREATEQWLAYLDYPIDLTDPSAVVPDTAPASAGAAFAKAFLALLRAPDEKAATADYTALDGKLVAAGAPIAVRAYAALQTVPESRGRTGGTSRAARLGALADRFVALPGGQRAAAWFRTEQALQLETNGALPQARELIASVVEQPQQTLPADDPIRSLAVLHLSLIDKRTGKAAEADSRLAAAGIGGEQCSLLDVRPVARNTAISSSVFPTEAMRWQFEGRATEAFDIAADGSVSDVRTVIAYPPFVFGPATEHAVQQFRFLPPTLGDQALGCTGEKINVRYVLP